MVPPHPRGNATPGRLINTILQHRIGNPVVVVDEVEKSGRATSTKGQAFSLPESLLPLLEPISAKAWSCPFYEVKFDMGWVIWVLTSNTYGLLPGPLLSRCPPIRLRALSLVELIAFARRQGARRDLSEVSIDAIIQALHGAARPPCSAGQFLSGCNRSPRPLPPCDCRRKANSSSSGQCRGCSVRWHCCRSRSGRRK